MYIGNFVMTWKTERMQECVWVNETEGMEGERGGEREREREREREGERGRERERERERRERGG